MEAPITIREAVMAVQKRDFLLPSIQREFVWTAEKTESLFDSLMRGYPVGSFLFWKVLPESSSKFKFYEFMQLYDAFDGKHLKPYEVAEPKTLTVVLDGQQRLTSLVIGILGYRADKIRHKWSSKPGAYPKKRLYLNLARKYQGTDELDREFDFRFLTEAEAAAKSVDFNWFPIRKVLDFADGVGINMGKLMQYSAEQMLGGWGAGTLGTLCDTLLKSPVIHYFQEDEQSLNRVLNVFVRLNSGGIPLSYSDLLLSIATAQWKADAREAIYGLVDTLNGVGDGFAFDKDFVLKSALVLTDRPDIGFNADNFDKENTEKIEADWEPSVRSPLLCAAELAASFGYYEKTLTSANVLIPVAYYLKRLGSPADFHVHPKYGVDRSRIRKWLVIALLKSVFGAKTDTLLSAVRSAIAGADPQCGFPLAAIESALLAHGRSLKFSEEELDLLLSAEYGKRNTFSVLAALYPGLNTQFKFHVDHVFPRGAFHKLKLRKAGLSDAQSEAFQDMFNALPNLQLLEGVANQAKLDTPFDAWIGTIRTSPDVDAWHRYRERHLIPDLPDYAIGAFETFFKARRALMQTRLRQALTFSDHETVVTSPAT